MKIQTTTTQTIEVTPKLLAEIFWEMDMQQQADFFDHLGSIAEEKLLREQIWNMVYSAETERTTRETMRTIGGIMSSAPE